MTDPTIIVFLTGGLFLGWSLGANDAANVFGTAVGSRMVRFTTAALICGIFVILGAIISGTGTSLTLVEALNQQQEKVVSFKALNFMLRREFS